MNEDTKQFDQDQYDILKRCSDKHDLTEWNEWTKQNPHEAIHLEGANLREAYLRQADLSKAKLSNADLTGANLKNATLILADIRQANFKIAIVDGGTLIWDCEIDKKTDFSGVGLDSARIDPESKQLLLYNVRRLRWERSYKYEDWYTDGCKQQRSLWGKLLKQPIKLFWQISDYGNSTGRIIKVFFAVSLFFACIYAAFPDLVYNLQISSNGSWALDKLYTLIRSIYFSVVTMTTLGFGDMHAAKENLFGHIMLTFQVLFGYVLLGALVTRFAVMFQAGGPTLTYKETKVLNEIKKKELEQN